ESPVKCADPVISGRMDYVIKHKEYSKAVVELKSINTRGFKALLDKPKPDHLIQLQIYLHLSKIEHGMVLYENKNDQQVKAFVVKKPGSTLEKQALINHCKEHLTHYKIPRKIEWIESLPKSNVGKILKRKLTQ
ncbi:MAG: hypothetical protein DSZ18_04070, partial [Candidatus Thioglobus sp.]